MENQRYVELENPNLGGKLGEEYLTRGYPDEDIDPELEKEFDKESELVAKYLNVSKFSDVYFTYLKKY